MNIFRYLWDKYVVNWNVDTTVVKQKAIESLVNGIKPLAKETQAACLESIRNIAIRLGIVSKTISFPEGAPLNITTERPVENNAIVQKPQTIAQFREQIYPTTGIRFPDAIQRNTRYGERLAGVVNYFGTPVIYPVRGDGNCFCNAAVAGILHGIKQGTIDPQIILTVIQQSGSDHSAYITPDVENNFDYMKDFRKDEDYGKVINGLEAVQHNKDTIDALADDFDFTASFSRILRYLLVINTQTEGMLFHDLFECDMTKTGKEMEAPLFVVLNKMFSLNIYVALVEGGDMSYPEGTNSATNACIFQPDPNAYFGQTQKIINLNDRLPDDIAPPSFVIIRKGGHFLTLGR